MYVYDELGTCIGELPTYIGKLWDSYITPSCHEKEKDLHVSHVDIPRHNTKLPRCIHILGLLTRSPEVYTYLLSLFPCQVFHGSNNVKGVTCEFQLLR